MYYEPRHRAKPVTARRLRRSVLSTSVATMALATASGAAPAFVLTGAEVRTAPLLGPTPAAPYSTPSEPTWDEPVVATSSRRTQHTVPGAGHADADRLDDIPNAAVVAYQRAAAVMAEASPGTRLHWTLLAAVGRILTDHGQRGSHRVDDRGHVRPGIIGKPVRARGGQRIGDTEAGLLDGDRRFDRPVGPMLLTPADWTVAGVDGDTDGRRNPQDLDDASLALAVLLCHSGEDLRTTKGKRAALRRLNTDPDFVRAVLEANDAYHRQLRSDAEQIEAVPLTTLPSLPMELTPPTAEPERTTLARRPADSGIYSGREPAVDYLSPEDPPGPAPEPQPEPQPEPTHTDVTATYDAEGRQIVASAVVSADGVAPTGGVTFTLTGPDGVEVVEVPLVEGSAIARFEVTGPGEFTVAASYEGTENHSDSEGTYVVQAGRAAPAGQPRERRRRRR